MHDCIVVADLGRRALEDNSEGELDDESDASDGAGADSDSVDGDDEMDG